MTKLVTIEELPQYAPGELKLDSSAVGRPDFRMRVFRYAPSDIWVPPTEDFLIVVYRQGATTMNRRVTGAWKQERRRPRHYHAADPRRAFALAMGKRYRGQPLLHFTGFHDENRERGFRS